MELDFQEYASAWTENISKLMVHSLMRVSRTISRHYPLSFNFFFFFFLTCRSFVPLQSLNEVMVISRRCLSVEDDLVCLKQRLAESEASQKSLNRAVFELNKEKRDLLGAVEAVKVELLAKEGDVKAAVDACDEAVKEMKHLMGQMEGARVCLLTDNNLSAFILGLKPSGSKLKRSTLTLISLSFSRITTQT
jgi:hypothetical protein